MLTIVIPMAGKGRRFVEAGYGVPKPLIPVNGQPMVKRVVDNVRPTCPHSFVMLMQREHAQAGGIVGFYDSRLILLDGLTEGAACTVYAAREVIGRADPVMVVNSDQLIRWDVNDFLAHCRFDGCIATFRSRAGQYSYVREEDGQVVEVAEKRVISDRATAGAYWFRTGAILLQAIDDMIAAGDRTNGEFYLAPVYNHVIRAGGIVTSYPVEGVDALGTPEDLRAYLDSHTPVPA